MCGDSTDKDDVDRLINVKKVDLVFNDPPYDLEAKQLFIVFNLCKGLSNLHFWMGSDKQQVLLCYNFFDDFTHFFAHDFKQATLISNRQPMSRHSLISKFGNRNINNTKDGFSTIIEVATERTLKIHETFRMGKRVDLPYGFIQKYTDKSDLIIDLFCGSGSTLIASERLERQCFTMELNPLYVDLTVERFCKHTENFQIIKNGEGITWKQYS